MEPASPLGLLGKLPSEVRNNVYDKLFRASYYGNNSYRLCGHRSNLQKASKEKTLSILCASKTISAEASVILYAQSTFKFDPAHCEAYILSRRPQVINYKGIRNLMIMIDNQTTYMSAAIMQVRNSDGHVLCELAEFDYGQGGYLDAAALVQFRETVVYAFFLNLPETEQEVKTFTLCLEMENYDSLTLLIDNSMEDPLVATGFARTLTMLVDLRKVVFEFNGAFMSPHGEHPDRTQGCALFQRMFERLGPCVEEKSQHDMGEERTFSKRFAFFPQAYWRSEMAK